MVDPGLFVPIETIEGREILCKHEMKVALLNETFPRWIVLAIFEKNIVTCRLAELYPGIYEFSKTHSFLINDLSKAVMNYKQRISNERDEYHISAQSANMYSKREVRRCQF